MRTVSTIITALLLTTSLACQSDGEKLTSEGASAQAATQTATQTATQVEEEAEVEEVAAATPSETSFWSAVEGADRLVITGDAESTPVEVTDATWLAKFQAAIGDGPGADTVPKCLSTYRITYFKADAELASFGAVCSAAEVAVFVRDGRSFSAEDADAVKAMLAEVTQP